MRRINARVRLLRSRPWWKRLVRFWMEIHIALQICWFVSPGYHATWLSIYGALLAVWMLGRLTSEDAFHP